MTTSTKTWSTNLFAKNISPEVQNIAQNVKHLATPVPSEKEYREGDTVTFTEGKNSYTGIITKVIPETHSVPKEYEVEYGGRWPATIKWYEIKEEKVNTFFDLSNIILHIRSSIQLSAYVDQRVDFYILADNTVVKDSSHVDDTISIASSEESEHIHKRALEKLECHDLAIESERLQYYVSKWKKEDYEERGKMGEEMFSKLKEIQKSAKSVNAYECEGMYDEIKKIKVAIGYK